MTGTALTSEEEFRKVYGLDTIVIPTNKDLKEMTAQTKYFKQNKENLKRFQKKLKN